MKKDEDPVEGLFAHIAKRSHVVPEAITLKVLEELIDKVHTEGIKQQALDKAMMKANLAHISRRERELGREAPMDFKVLFMIYPTPYVGTEFVKRYKEWLED